jgi:hypothetical protein
MVGLDLNKFSDEMLLCDDYANGEEGDSVLYT